MKFNLSAVGAAFVLATVGSLAWADSQEMRSEAANPDGTVGGVRSECQYCTKDMPVTMISEATRAERARRMAAEQGGGAGGASTTDAVREEAPKGN